LISITPYKELLGGDESIHDHVGGIDEDIPVKVLDYLRAGNAYVMSPGIYDHPFIAGKRLLGPYILTDNIRYTWDRDTWKYVVKYGLELPSGFTGFVLSDEGDKAFESMAAGSTWSDVIQEWKGRAKTVVYLPADAADSELDDF
jgi:hypothetical protein